MNQASCCKILFLFVVFSSVLLNTFGVRGQDSTIINIESSDRLFPDPDPHSDALWFTGNVVFRQDSTWFYCDSAKLYQKSNTMNAYSRVHIIMEDSTEIFGDSLHYQGDTKIAHIYDSVRLIDDQGTLYTDMLIYDRKTKIGSYITGGKIVDSSNVLTSVRGYYYTELDQFYFQDDVFLENPDYVMFSDTMLYNTKTEIVTMLGPTEIVSDSNTIRGTSGWYNTKTDISEFDERASLDNGKQILFGDSLYYDRNVDFGKAIHDVVLFDRENKLYGFGNYGEYWKQEHYAYLTDSAVSIMIEAEDTLFMHGDTIRVLFDENDDAEFLRCFNKTKFFRDDLQGMCDSLQYIFADSTINMYDDPILWSDKSQMTGDTIIIKIEGGSISKLFLVENSFIISHDSLTNYNQIQGANTVAHFIENELKIIDVDANAQSIYYIRDDDTRDLIGIMKAKSSAIRFYLQDGEINDVIYKVMPEVDIYPEGDLSSSDQVLKGFVWLEDYKPKKKEDIFIWNKE